MASIIPIVVAAAATASGNAEPAMTHDAEVKLFASTVATVKVVADACPHMLVNLPYLAGLRDRLHMSDADKPAFSREASAVAAALAQGLSEAPSREAWCAAADRLYGPGGSMIPDLFGR